jgi:hypothetical protein
LLLLLLGIVLHGTLCTLVVAVWVAAHERSMQRLQDEVHDTYFYYIYAPTDLQLSGAGKDEVAKAVIKIDSRDITLNDQLSRFANNPTTPTIDMPPSYAHMIGQFDMYTLFLWASPL